MRVGAGRNGGEWAQAERNGLERRDAAQARAARAPLRGVPSLGSRAAAGRQRRRGKLGTCCARRRVCHPGFRDRTCSCRQRPWELGWAVPLATISSLVIASALYVVLHASCVAAVPGLAQSEAPLVDAARGLGGARVATLVAFGTNISALGIAFGMFAMTPRYLAALGNDTGLGTWVARQDHRNVPQRALWLSVAVVVVAVLSGRLMQLFALSSVAVLAQYGMTVASLTALAARRERGLGLSHTWPAPLAIVVVVLVARAARPGELGVAFGVLLAGGVALAVRRAWLR